MAAKVKDLGPLDWQVPIVDKGGAPSPEFQRRWNTQRGNNGLISTVTLGSGAPTSTPVNDGDEYVDIGASPAILYVTSAGAWVRVGIYKFIQLADAPSTYAGSTLDLVQVNPGETALRFVTRFSLTANPTATASDTAVNGAASTFMRSDAAPAVQKGTAAQFGVVKVDGTTIMSAAGVISAPAALGGTVTSVGLALPAIFSVTGSPVTVAGTLTATLATQSANTIFAGPTTGAAAAPTFRAMVAADIPNTAVAAGSYTHSSITVDAQGRITAASSGAAPPTAANPSAQVGPAAINGAAATFMRSDAAPKLADTTVTPGAYTYAGFTVDQQGRITAAASGSAPVAPPTAANPSAQVGPAAINGAAATFMRSDAAPKLADTTVTPGTYGDSTHVGTFTVDQQGRLTAASNVAVSGGGGSGISSGTAFPGSPASNDLFFRTDRSIIYFYDLANTRWLSVDQYVLDLHNISAFFPISATTTFMIGHANPWSGIYSFLVERFQFSAFINAATTSANYFTAALIAKSAAADATLGTASSQSNTQSNWVMNSISINTVVASTVIGFEVSFTKVGTQNLFSKCSLTGRLVG